MMLKFIALTVILGVTSAATYKRWPLIRPNGGRIVGGSDVSIEAVPYQISLYYLNSFICGGSIISEEWIVTAGHCARSHASSYSVHAGSNRAQGGSRHHVVEVIVHEEFGNSLSPGFDIALMRVDNPFEFDETRKPIQLYDQDEESIPGEISVITGWGHTSPRVSPVLQLVEVPIVSKRECYDNYIDFGGVPDDQICAGYSEGGKDACQGDSGGPLAINGRLAGITSWGNGCAKPGYPGVYTEVAAHRQWILRNAGV